MSDISTSLYLSVCKWCFFLPIKGKITALLSLACVSGREQEGRKWSWGCSRGGEGTKDQKIISLALITAVGKTAPVLNSGLAV